MSTSKTLLRLAAPAALLALGACATGLPTQVSRFQAMPAPQGQSFVIQSADPMDRGLEFSQYAGLVRQHLIAQGYSEAPSAQAASLIVSVDYGVDQGEEKVVARPGAFSRYGYGYDSFGGYRGFGSRYGDPRLRDPFFRHPYYARRYGRDPFLFDRDPFYRPYYSRYGYGAQRRSPFYMGWEDPYWYSPYGYGYEDLRSYTVYTSHLDMKIKRAADGQPVFEGTAKARSRTGELQALVPNLVEAMFTNFPGRSGETVRITVPPAPRAR
ncbi:MAG TPA: DUF4136 domain-containing protein [Allosphingosinicella sp.]